jgi:hypothetical protein
MSTDQAKTVLDLLDAMDDRRGEDCVLEDLDALIRAVRVPLRLHHPLPALDPQHPNRRVCDRCDQPWPCYEYKQIARALTGKAGTDE